MRTKTKPRKTQAENQVNRKKREINVKISINCYFAVKGKGNSKGKQKMLLSLATKHDFFKGKSNELPVILLFQTKSLSGTWKIHIVFIICACCLPHSLKEEKKKNTIEFLNSEVQCVFVHIAEK